MNAPTRNRSRCGSCALLPAGLLFGFGLMLLIASSIAVASGEPEWVEFAVSAIVLGAVGELLRRVLFRRRTRD